MKKINWFTMKSSPSDASFLLKYHPKYYYKIQFSSSNIQKQKFFAKFKSIKIVKSLDSLDYGVENRSLAISAFKSQRHCLEQLDLKDLELTKYFPNISTFFLCSKIYSSWRVFLKLRNLKSLTIECPYVRDTKRSPYVKRMGKMRGSYQGFWRHFIKLQKLKDFHIHISHKLDPEILNLLGKLNSLEGSLGSLENFSLFLSHIDVINSDEIINLDLENLYKYLTCLKIHESSFFTIQTFLQHLDQFKNLQRLDILKNLHYSDDENPSLNFDYLAKLQQAVQIKSLDILINFGSDLNFLSFLQHFSIPQDIISLKLSFYEADWTSLIPIDQLHDLKTFNVFDKNPLCLSFYNKWENLNSLEFLSLCFCEKSSNEIVSLYFAIPILKKLTTLKSLYFANWVHSFSDIPHMPQKLKALNFYSLWEALMHLKPSLKKLYVDSSAISLRKFPDNFELEQEEKLSLREFGLCGLVVGDVYLEALSQALDKNPLETERGTSSRMEIEALIVDNKESMVKLMEILERISKRVQVSMSLDLRNINAQDFMDIVMKSLGRMMGKSHVKIDFSKIPDLQAIDVRNFRRLFKEYQASISPRKYDKFDKERAQREISLSVQEESFEDSNDITSEESDEEDSEDGFEEESSEISFDEGEMFDDELEEIDEDI